MIKVAFWATDTGSTVTRRTGATLLRHLLGGVVAAWLLAGCGDSGTGPPPPEPPANRAPQAHGSIPEQALKVDGSAATVNVADNFADPDGDALSYTVSVDQPGVAAASVSGSVVTVRPVGPGTTISRVTARDPGGLTAELSFLVTVTVGPDLEVSVSPDSVAVAPGGAFRFSMTIRNRGDAGTSATRVRTFESADTAITTSDDEIGEPADVPALAPGEIARGRVDVTVQRSALAGTVLHLGACVDAVEGELSTANNCSNALKIVVRATGGNVGEIGPFRTAWTDSASAPALRIDRSRLVIIVHRKEGGQ